MYDDDENWVGKGLPSGPMTPKNPTKIEKVKLFLQFRVEDAESADEIAQERFRAFFNQAEDDVKSLEALEWLANETPDGVSLTEIVKWDANYVIDTGTDEVENPDQAEREAKLWLLEFAEFVREILGDKVPPRKYPVLTSRPRQYFFPE
jgi:hypothetical protein